MAILNQAKLVRKSKTRKTRKRAASSVGKSVLSNSFQLNYIYNQEEKNVSSFARLARRMLGNSTDGSISQINVTVVKKRNGISTERNGSITNRKFRELKHVTLKKTAPKKAAKKAAPKKAAPKKAAPKKAAKKAR